MSAPDGIRPSVRAPLGALGLVVEDVAVTPAGRRRVVRIAVDRDLGEAHGDHTELVPSLTLDEVAEATRAVSDALDADGTMGELPYTLEVTSPGVDRPLTEPHHFRRNVTRMLALTLHEGEPVTGRLVRAGEDFTVVVPAERKSVERTVVLRYADVARAVVQVEFSRPKADVAGDGSDGDDASTDHTDEEQEA